MPLYACSSCGDNIGLQKPRLHCTVCHFYEICANCYVLSTYTGSHTPDHITTLFRQSGIQLAAPPPLPPRRTPVPGQQPTPQHIPQYAPVDIPQAYVRPEANNYFPGAQQQQTSQYSAQGQGQPSASTQYQQIPQYIPQGQGQNSTPVPSQQIPQYVPQGPSESSAPAPAQQLANEQQQNERLGAGAFGAGGSQEVPRSSPPSQAQAVPIEPVAQPSHSPPIFAPPGWNPIFDGCEPSATGAAFFNAVFDCLDTQNRGLLSPEQYSAFNDVQGYLPDQDVWKRANKQTFGYNSEDLADYEFRTVLENFSFEFVLQPRITKPNNDMDNMLNSVPGLSKSFATLMSKTASPTPISGGQMPMLTRKGFIDITTLEVLGDPSLGWHRLNCMAKHYNIWRELGDCPREMLPQEAPKTLLERIARVSEYSKRQAAEKIEATRVEMELRAQGREQAVRLTDPPGTKYYYRY